MSSEKTDSHQLILAGISGANPLGFLAALGVLVAARQSGSPRARLGWKRSISWVPELENLPSGDAEAFSENLAVALRGKSVHDDARTKRSEAERVFSMAKKAVHKKREEIKNRKLKGKERTAAMEAELAPVVSEMDEKRKAWMEALKEAVPRNELAIGQHLNCTVEEFREFASSFVSDASLSDREAVDLLAAFGGDLRAQKSERMFPTPFCFITGSGHQYFLDTVGDLLQHVSADRIYETLFKPWTYRDEKLSMRWDPLEDRRYALMDRDPTASDNKSRTVWMANLLAYRSLVLFPTAPTARALGTTAWSTANGESVFTWPLWEQPLSPDSIRSLIELHELGVAEPDLARIRERGAVAAFRCRRIRIGKYVNFSAARTLIST